MTGPLKRRILLGTDDTYEHDPQKVYLNLEIRPEQMIGRGRTIDLEPIPDNAVEVAITADLYDRRGRETGGGQSIDAARAVGTPKALRIVELWERWHLNGMRAGCRHQIDEGWNKRPIDPSHPHDRYGRWFEGQKSDSWNLLGWIRPSEHHDGLLTKECPTCGYAYGTAWLYEQVPTEVIDELVALFSEDQR